MEFIDVNKKRKLFDWEPRVARCSYRRYDDVNSGLEKLSVEIYNIFGNLKSAEAFVERTLVFLDQKSKPLPCSTCGVMAKELVCGACRRTIVSQGKLCNGPPKETAQSAYLNQFSDEMIKRAKKVVERRDEYLKRQAEKENTQ